jgi:hypothetical protein
MVVVVAVVAVEMIVKRIITEFGIISNLIFI